MKTVSAASMPAGGVVVWAANAATFVLSVFTLPLEAIYRHEFGERYFKLLPLLISAALYYVFAVGFTGLMGGFGAGLGLTSGPSSGGNGGLLKWLYLALFLGLAVWHRARIFRRNWYTGPEWHSHASGISWLQRFTTPLRDHIPLFIPVPNATQRYIEPLLAVIVGTLIDAAGSYIGAWVIVGGIALFLKETIKAEILRNAYLDQVDQQIESAATVELLTDGWTEESTTPQTSVTRNGYTASIPLPTRTAKQRQDSRTVLRDLYPDEWNRAEKRKEQAN